MPYKIIARAVMSMSFCSDYCNVIYFYVPFLLIPTANSKSVVKNIVHKRSNRAEVTTSQKDERERTKIRKNGKNQKKTLGMKVS